MQKASTVWNAIASAGIAFFAAACGGGGSPAMLPNMPGGDAVVPAGDSALLAERAAQPNANGLFNVLMHPQEPEPLPLKGASWAAPSELFSLLPPLPVEKDPSCTGSGFMMSGGDFEDGLLSNRVVRTGAEDQYAFFSPYWTGGDMDGAALAVYRWNLRGFDGSQTMGFTWDEGHEPKDWSAFWVGFGDLTQDSWDWYAGPQDNVLTVDTFGPYRAASDEMLMVVVLLGTDQTLLEKLEAGAAEQRATGDDIELPEGLTSIPLLGFSGALPSAVDLSAECAPINDQLSWYACTAFAVGDSAFNFELGRMYGPLGWDLSRDNFLVSPKYLYITSGEMYGYPPGPLFGRYTEKVIRTLYLEGIATEANAPYDGIYAKDWGEAAEHDAEVLACDNWVEVPCNTWEGVETVKAVLARQRKVLPMRVNLNDDFYNYDGTGVWYPQGLLNGGHAMCIVGYDDARGDAGAFMVRNSWGKYWGDDGHAWIDYRTFLNPAAQASTWVLYEDYSPAVVEHFGLAVPQMPPPTGVAASDGDFADYIEVSWDPYPSATELSIYRDKQDSLAAAVTGDSSSWQDTEINDSYGHIYWVQADQSALSSPDVGFLAALPDVLSVEPTTGLEGETVTFVAGGTGSGPMTYVWHFGGGATPNISYDPRPQVELGEPDVYSAYVTVRNELGEDTFDFDLTITGYPPHISYITGRSGFSGDTITLSAGLEGETSSFNWSIPQGATPATSTESAPQLTLGEPGLYEGTLEVTGPWGSDIRFFELVVLDASLTAWTLPGFDGRNSGQSPVLGPQTSNLKWKYYIGDYTVGVDSNHCRTVLVLDDGSLVISCDADLGGASLRRINADGSQVWLLRELGSSGRFGQPLLGQYSNRLYVVRNSILESRSLGSGALNWYYHPEPDGVIILPVAESNQSVLYAIIGGKTLVALASVDGEDVMEPYQLADRYNVAGPGLIAPSGTLFIASEFGGDDLLIAFDTNENTPLGSLVVPESVTGMALSADGRTLFTADTAGETRAYDTASCRELWHQPLTAGGGGGTPTNAPRVMADGTVITANKADLICALHPDTGAIIWGYGLPPESDCFSAPAIGRDGTVYLGGSKGKLYAVRDDALIWQSAEAESQYFNGDPSLGADGTLYCGANDGWLYAFGVGGGDEFVAPSIRSVTPLEGYYGQNVTFSAELDGSEPLEYSWDFGAAAFPSTSTEASPTVNLGFTGTHICELTVSNAFGDDTYEFSLSITTDPDSPGWKSYTIYDFVTPTNVYADVAHVAGKPAVALVDTSEGKLRYFYSDVADPDASQHWHDETILTSPMINQPPSLADFDSQAAVVFEYSGTGLLCSRKTATNWQAHSIHDSAADFSRYSLAMVNGYPAVAYLFRNDIPYNLRYARATTVTPGSSDDWIAMDVGDAQECQYNCPLALIDNAGIPNISFCDRNDNQPYISFARATMIDPLSSTDWTWHIVDANEDRGHADMLLLSGVPVIAFNSLDGLPTLYYAKPSSATPSTGADWSIHSIDQDPMLAMGSLALVGGKPAIGYYSGTTTSVLSLAQSNETDPADGDDWQRQQLPSQNQLLGFLSVGGEPVYILYSLTDSSLEYFYYFEGE